MIENIIGEIITTITKLINAFNIMPITEDVSLMGIIIWTVYISIILYFMKKLIEVVL